MARAATAATALRRVRRQSPSSATGWGRDPVTVARSLQVDFEISAELYGEFRGVLSDEAIRGFVREAPRWLTREALEDPLPGYGSDEGPPVASPGQIVRSPSGVRE